MRALISAIKPNSAKIAVGTRRRGSRWSSKRLRLLSCLFMTIIGLGISAEAWLVPKSGIVGQTYRTTVNEITNLANRAFVDVGLTVKHVFVTGRGETSKAQVLAAIGIEKSQSIMGFNPRIAQQRLLNLSWVEIAQVERRLPDTIIVKLQERKALAVWQHNSRHALIDPNGQIITTRNLNRFAHLPIVVGRDAPNAASKLIAMLARKPELYAQVQAAVRIGGRRWDIRLKNGIKVQLPEKGAFAAWLRLAQLEAENEIFKRDVVAIDLRLPDRLVVRLTPTAASKRNKNGKET